ncbi:MAG TPA: hypothetical protein VFS67_14890 [Polyangiaceae bacterium]|jgi:hypothetical protein|nr:hypothetical protein [Polyangiaceae bacterium]
MSEDRGRVSRPAELGATAVDQLDLSPEVKGALKEVQAELAEAYRESFLLMVEAINKQASAIERIQTTLELLVKHTQPSLAPQLPAVVRVAGDGEEPDLASALMVADPIGAGYTLGVSSLSKALGLSAADVGVLLKAFKINVDGSCAVVVRQGGPRNTMVNYHPRTIDKFLSLVANPPPGLDANQMGALKRVQKRGITLPPGPALPAGAPPVASESPKRKPSRPPQPRVAKKQ